jgi:rhamnosyltransferase
MKIAGSVIIYYPEIKKVLENIRSYLSFIEVLFVIDNTPGTNKDYLQDLLSSGDKIKYVAKGQNEGVAKALNRAAEMGMDHGYQWLLTMDQDSSFSENTASLFFEKFQLLQSDEKNAVIAPAQKKKEKLQTDIEKAISVITSGSIIRLEVWKALGGFEEKLFIDEVDYDFCYRVILAKYAIVRCNEIPLQHELGKKNLSGYLSVYKTLRTVHSPQRVYFMVRNYLFVRKKYQHFFKKEFEVRDKQMLTELKNNLFFSGCFWSTLRSIYRGLRDYQRNNFSGTI